jgi:inactivated superfamily I helicase
MPERIAGLEAEKARIELKLSDPALFRNSPDDAAATSKRLVELAAQLDSEYGRWDALESLSAAGSAGSCAGP